MYNVGGSQESIVNVFGARKSNRYGVTENILSTFLPFNRISTTLEQKIHVNPVADNKMFVRRERSRKVSLFCANWRYQHPYPHDPSVETNAILFGRSLSSPPRRRLPAPGTLRTRLREGAGLVTTHVPARTARERSWAKNF